jgi:EAL and modified HD-GYP domain-containing signal transduction protein
MANTPADPFLHVAQWSQETGMNLNIFSSIWRKQAELESNLIAIDSPVPSTLNPLAEAKAAEPRRFIARQTIFDRNRDVYGYELLFRSGWENCFRGDTDDATRKMIADGALYGFHELTNGAPSFVNCTRESLVNGLVTLLPNSTVLEILETVVGDQEIVDACKHYKSLGYRLALDDFQMRAGMEGLIELADYVKVDFRLSDAKERAETIALFKGKKVTLLAEKVETEQEFQAAMAEGFTLFQGYFFCYPTVFSKKRAPTNGANYLYLLSALSNGAFDVIQLSLMLKSEVALSYQLLRLVNSGAYGRTHEVRSLQDALVLVGEQQFRKLMMNAIATETCRNRSSELLVHVLHRARFLELMAPFTGESATEQFLFGLLSLMDVMLDMPMVDLIAALPLHREMKAALAGEINQVSAALKLFERYKDADWAFCMEQSLVLHSTEGQLSDLYTESLLWAEKAVGTEPRKSLKAS